MRIFIMGTGHIGAWLVEELCLDHEIAVFDIDKKKMKYFFNVKRFFELSEVREFVPELVINATSLNKTIESFEEVMPYLTEDVILSDVASVKSGLKDYYAKIGKKYVSTHPMFGPTFGNIRDLRNENAIIIKESDDEGKTFFQNFYKDLQLSIFEYSFKEHDETIAYSLSIPFASSMVFAACMKKQDAPGTTFRRHHEIAKGLLSEDDYLISEIMFSENTLTQVEKINSQLSYLTHIIKGKDMDEMKKFLEKLRKNI